MIRSIIQAFIFFAVIQNTLNSAEGPKFQAVASQLFQVRDGLPRLFQKLEAGQEVRVAYLGGSITAQPGWRVKSLAWLGQQFPQAKLHEINAAIGGTGSDLGVYRLEHDVLRHKPDLLFVEFAVNDGDAPPQSIWRAFDGIVRQTWSANPETEICFIYTFRNGYETDLQKGVCPRAASADEMLAQHYGIPSINFALRMVQLHDQKKLIIASAEDKPQVTEGVTLFSKDGVHPLDAGHDRYQEVLVEAFTAMRSQKTKTDNAAKLKTPFVTDHWQAAKLVPLQKEMLSSGWRVLDRDKGMGKQFGSRMDDLWEASAPGETIRFRFRGTAVKLYDILGPDGGQVMVTVDGKTRGPVARFDKYSRYHRLATLSIAEGLEDKEHEVEIKIHPDQPNRNVITDEEKTKPGYDPKKYDGTMLRVGGIMLIGEVLPAAK